MLSSRLFSAWRAYADPLRRRAFNANPSARILFVTPRKALARLVSIRIRRALSQSLNVPTLLLAHSKDLDEIPRNGPIIVVTAPTPLLKQMLATPTVFDTLDLIVAHDLHALDPSYELLLSRVRWAHPRTRVVGSSASLADASSMASWLGVPESAVYSFAPSTRTSALTTAFQPFSTPHSIGLLRSMIKPAYAAMRTASGSTLCFVPSRSQCRATAKDLVTQTATDLDESFVSLDAMDTIENLSHTISDPDLAEALTHGIAVFHEGLRPEEQRLALELFAAGTVRILIASREASWTLPIRASLVIVLSAQYAIVRPDNEREIKDYPLPELLQMQSLAVPPSSDASAEFLVLCQKDQADLYGRYLNQGVPVESSLAADPDDPLLAQTVLSLVVKGDVKDRQDIVDFLSWTFAAQRVEANASYYSDQASEAPIARLADRVVVELEARCAVLCNGKTGLAPSTLGKWLVDKSIGTEQLAKLQATDLDQLVAMGDPPRKKATTNGDEKTTGDETSTKPVVIKSLLTVDDEPLQAFHHRLPRAVRDAIGEVKEDEAEGGNDGSRRRRRILLAAFAAGRVPRGKEGESLEAEQAAVVRKLLEPRGRAK